MFFFYSSILLKYELPIHRKTIKSIKSTSTQLSTTAYKLFIKQLNKYTK